MTRTLKDEAWRAEVLDVIESTAMSDLRGALRLAHAALRDGNAPPAVALPIRVKEAEFIFRLGDGDRAREVFERVLADAETHEIPAVELKALSGLGAVEVLGGTQQAAIEYMRRALTIAEALQDHRALMSLYNNLGVCYERQGDFPESLRCLLACLRLEVEDRRIEAAVLHNVANCYKELREYATALDFCNRSLTVVEEIGLVVGRPMRLNLKAEVHVARGNPKLAEPILVEALSLASDMQDNSERAHALTIMSRIALDKGELQTARSTIDDAVRFAERAADHNARVRAMLGSGEVHLAAQSFELAHRCFDRARGEATELGSRVREAEALNGLARAAAARSDFKAAYRHLAEYDVLNSELESYRTEQRVRALTIEVDLDDAKRDLEVFRAKTQELQKANEALEAFKLQNEALLAQLRRQNREDHLTGLYNRRYLDEMLAKEWYRSQRYQRPLTVAMADLDYFKRVNDRHSHQVGDAVLQRVAEIILERVRQTDLVARFGGEEFVIVFPEADLREAHQCCEDIRDAVARYDWSKVDCPSRVTISIGLADRGDSAEELLANADRQLYAAKSRGRDRVAVNGNEAAAS